MGPAVVALWGDEHTELEQVAAARVDERTAVALSRGRYPKPYPHVDPNEDAVLGASGPAGTLLAVADGHFGFDAARAALRAVAARAPALVGDAAEPPAEGLKETCWAAAEAVGAAVAAREEPRADSRTALTLALVADEYLHVATYGDTVCVRERAGKGKAVGHDGWPFLGPGVGVPRIERVRLRRRDRVAVASDGLTTYLGRDWPARIAAVLTAATDPRGAAQHLIELAMDGGAGDHVGVGVAL